MPIANIDTFHAEKLGKADLVQEQTTLRWTLPLQMTMRSSM